MAGGAVALPQAAPTPIGGLQRDRCGFGEAFTAMMVTSTWVAGHGWDEPVLSPRAPLSIDPAMVGLHYGQVVFEGLKAYRRPDGRMCVFRPDAYARRMQASARRFMMPEPPAELFVSAVRQLARADESWLPTDPDLSLYLRPILFATEPCLALRPSTSYLFLVLAFVTGGFFSDAPDPISVRIEENHVRAAPGGTGAAKCAGNYAPTYPAQANAVKEDCHQVVWLDARERAWVEEMSGMNLFFVHGAGLAPVITTPPLDGTILPGVTRDAIIELASADGQRVKEAPMSVAGWRDGCAVGDITEVFACGTAAGVTPVGAVVTSAASWVVGEGKAGPVTLRLRDRLWKAQRGLVPDTFGWLVSA